MNSAFDVDIRPIHLVCPFLNGYASWCERLTEDSYVYYTGVQNRLHTLKETHLMKKRGDWMLNNRKVGMKTFDR